MSVGAPSARRATWPPSAAVRQRSIALITFNWSRLTWPALAERHAAPWAGAGYPTPPPRTGPARRPGRPPARPPRGGGGPGRRRLRRRRSLLALPRLLARLCQQVERALDGGDHAGGDAGVAGRGVEFGVTQERLDDADIGAAFEQMRCKAVAQRV